MPKKMTTRLADLGDKYRVVEIKYTALCGEGNEPEILKTVYQPQFYDVNSWVCVGYFGHRANGCTSDFRKAVHACEEFEKNRSKT